MSKKKKYYVVWWGREIGIFTDWNKCKAQVEGFEGAKYKSFPSQEEAEHAFGRDYKDVIAESKASGGSEKRIIDPNAPQPIIPSVSVDAACSGNPGKMEYRGVWTETGSEWFKKGVFEDGTNNVGEFLALVHMLALLKKEGLNYPIYSDSKTAMSWVRQKKCKTKLEPTSKNVELFDLIRRAEVWLNNNSIEVEIGRAHV